MTVEVNGDKQCDNLGVTPSSRLSQILDRFAKQATSPNPRVAWRSGKETFTTYGERSYKCDPYHFASQGAIAPWYPSLSEQLRCEISITKRRKMKQRNKKRIK
jgi:hypothetical protein